MTLRLNLTLAPAEALAQQSPLCRVEVINARAEAVSIVPPYPSGLMPILSVLNRETGIERVCRKELPFPVRRRKRLLPPGKGVESSFLLHSRMDPLPSGDYEISAVYEEDGDVRRAESKPCRLQVLPATPAHLVLDTVQTATSYGFWVNLAGDPPELVRTAFEILPGRGVTEVIRIAKAGASIRPVPSRTPNGKPLDSHWVAWLEGGNLKAVHLDADDGASPEIQMPLPPGPCEIVFPLHSDLPAAGRPNGSALILAGGRLQLFTLRPGAMQPGPAVALEGPRPVWIMSHERSDEKRWVTYLQACGESIALRAAPWPDHDGPHRKLEEWKGTFVAAAATMDFEDILHGGHLLWREGLEWVGWEIDARGDFRAREAVPVPWEAGRIPACAALRVSVQGSPAALLHDVAGGVRCLYDGAAVRDLPQEISTSASSIEIAFWGETEPILICAEPSRGFRIMRPDGSPLPPKSR